MLFDRARPKLGSALLDMLLRSDIQELEIGMASPYDLSDLGTCHAVNPFLTPYRDWPQVPTRHSRVVLQGM